MSSVCILIMIDTMISLHNSIEKDARRMGPWNLFYGLNTEAVELHSVPFKKCSFLFNISDGVTYISIFTIVAVVTFISSTDIINSFQVFSYVERISFFLKLTTNLQENSSFTQSSTSETFKHERFVPNRIRVLLQYTSFEFILFVR